MHRVTTVVASFLLAFSGALAPCRAQRTVSVDSGRLVRLDFRSGRHTDGRLLSAITGAGAAIRYCRCPGPPCQHGDTARIVVISWKDIERIQVNHGNRGVLGALIGLGVGAAVSPLYGSAWQCETPGCHDHDVRNEIAITVGLGILGYALGRTSIRWGAP